MWKIAAGAIFALASAATSAGGKPDVTWVVGPVDAPDGFAEIWTGEKSRRSIWRLLSMTHTVLAKMTEPPLSAEHFYSFGECTDGSGERNDLIVEISVSDPHGEFATAYRAWHLDVASRSITPASVAGLTCYNPDYGF